MSKKNEKTPKFPCGECGIGVKYSAILCTGPCNLWFHGGCANMTPTTIKQLSKEEISSWICKSCIINPKKNKNQLNPDFQKALTDAENLEERINKLSLNEDQDLETSLTLAAEAGNLLLSENNSLKQENSLLKTTSFDLKSNYHKIQSELEDKLKIAEEQIESLSRQIDDLKHEHTLEVSHLNEKLRTGSQWMGEFEEQVEKEKCIYVNKIKYLEGTVTKICQIMNGN